MLERLNTKLRADIWQSFLGVVALFIIMFEIARQAQAGFSWATLLLAFAVVAVALRVRFPECALALQLLVVLAMAILVNGPPLVGWGLVQVCLLSLASLRGRKTIIVSVTSALVVVCGTVALTDPGNWRELASWATWIVMSAGVGAAVRIQRKYIHTVQDQAARAIDSRESEAQRRVAEERLRIARELHDSVAHHIAVIGMFTGLARTTLTTSPEQAEQALARSQEATRTVLTELQQILRLLRESGIDPKPTNGSLERPVPGLDDLDDLIHSFTSLGMSVHVAITGVPQSLPVTGDTAAYWVIQEALTNAHKHGDGSVGVQVDYRHTTLAITVVNRKTQTPGSTNQPGFGLVGMRERVRAASGTLVHGQEGTTYRVAVTLPLGDSARVEPVARQELNQEGAV